MTDYTYTEGDGSDLYDLDDQKNWSPEGIPQSVDDVEINLGDNQTTPLFGTLSANDLAVFGYYTYFANANVTVNDISTGAPVFTNSQVTANTVTASINVNNGSTLTVTDSVAPLSGYTTGDYVGPGGTINANATAQTYVDYLGDLDGTLNASIARFLFVYDGGTATVTEIDDSLGQSGYPAPLAAGVNIEAGGQEGIGSADATVTATNIVNNYNGSSSVFLIWMGPRGTIPGTAKLTATNIYSASGAHFGLNVTVGANSSLIVTNYDDNSATPAGLTNVLNITSGGNVTVQNTIGIGRQAGDNSTIDITGSGSQFTYNGSAPFTVGNAGSGTVTVSSGGTATVNADLVLGNQSSGNGTLTIAGSGTTVNAGGSVTIGEAGTGTVTVSGGATLDASNSDVFVADQEGSTGTLTVDGSNSTLDAADLTIGGLTPDAANLNNGQDGNWTYVGGTGTLTISDDASVTVDSGLQLQDDVETGADGTETAEGGIYISSGGSLEVGGNGSSAADTLQVDADGTLVGHGLITGTETGEVPVSDTTTTPTYSLDIDNDGTIEADDGTLVLDGNLSGDGQVLVGNDSTLELGGTVDDDVTVMFLPGEGEKIVIDDPEDFNGVISSENFEPGDEIDLPNVPYVDPGPGDSQPGRRQLLFRNRRRPAKLRAAGRRERSNIQHTDQPGRRPVQRRLHAER